MSKAIQETLKKLEQTTISEPTTAAAAPSSSSSSLSSSAASSSPQQRDVSPARSANDANSLGTAPVVAPGADQSVGEDSVLGRGRNRRIVQSMYGAPPGYNATMGVGGGRETLGRGRVGSGRQRNSIMVPDQLQAAMHPQSMVPMAPLQTPVTRLTGAEYALMANMPDDAIPNAIVVKNINFAIKREELLQTIADLGLPLPYAFNYHFDNSVFRGLAFGNFRTPEEAARVIVGLNGLSLLGRPLKVEYKKALPGTAPPPHPNTIAMMNSAGGAPMGVGGVETQTGGGYGGALSAGNMQSNNQQYDRPIPRPRRNQNGDVSERPRSMMVFPSSMPIPDTSPSNQHQIHQNNAKSPSPSNDTSSMIDLDDEATRTLYDVVSHFRHDKSIAELEFPCSLNTKQRQTIMLIAERFGINHETKSDANGRYIRVYKGLNTLLEGTEVRRRSMASPNTGAMSAGSQTMRYGSSQGRSRPSSMLYPDSLSMGGMASPPPQQQQQQQQQRMNSYHQPQNYQQNQDPMRMRSFTHSQAGAMSQFNGAMQYQQQQQQQQQTQQYQTTQQFTRTSDNQNRASGNYGGYPSRLYQDSVVVPVRHPRGPDMSQNFAGRQQMHAQEERHAQRQVQLKVLQQIRQRRLSSAGEDGSSIPATPSAQPAASGASNSCGGSSASSSAGIPSVFRIGKPGSKAIPIVKPKEEEEDDDEEGDYELVTSPGSSQSHSASPKASSIPSSSSMAAGQRQEQTVGRDSQ